MEVWNKGIDGIIRFERDDINKTIVINYYSINLLHLI